MNRLIFLSLLLLLFHESYTQEITTRDPQWEEYTDIRGVAPVSGIRKVEIRKPATASSFASEKVILTLSSIPEAPEFTINCHTMFTEEAIPETVEYSTSPDMSSPESGTGVPLFLTVGQTYYFRYKAGVNTFASPIFTLTVPGDPQLNLITLDYQNEKLENLPQNAQWQIDGATAEAARSDISSLIPASGDTPVKLEIFIPGMKGCSGEDGIRTIMLSPRPQLTIARMKVKASDPAFIPEMSTTAGDIRNILLTSSKTEVATISGQMVRPVKEGTCEITAFLPAMEAQHFASLETKATLLVESSGGEGAEDKDELKIKKVYIPESGMSMTFRVESPDDASLKSLQFFNRGGKMIHKTSAYKNDFDMSGLKSGTYYYILTYELNGTEKIKKGFVEIFR